MATVTSVAELQALGIVEEIIRRFDSPDIGIALLHRVGWDAESMPVMDDDVEGFWTGVLLRLESNEVANGLPRLLEEIADLYPYLGSFARWRRPESLPEARKPTGAALVVHVQSTVSPQRVKRLVDLLNQAVAKRSPGNHARLEYITAGSWNAHMFVDNMTPTQLQAIWGDLEVALRNDRLFQGISVFGRICTHRFPDGLLSQLNAERCDGSRVQIENAPLSSTARDIGTPVHEGFQVESGQVEKGGMAPRVTVDRRKADGSTQRLGPDQTLMEAGIQENDTLEVAQESTAGVHPQTREEALSRVRLQVLEYARAHPEFQVSANSALAPTEYLFHFRATGIQPPEAAGSPPTLIQEHEVLLILSAEFPMKAPLAIWQTPLFHPNIHPDNGFVCLGELQDKYRPGLHFGQLCQILVDMAGFKNYELSHVMNPEAASWLASIDGQHMLMQMGGKLWQKDLMERSVASPIRLKMKRVDS